MRKPGVTLNTMAPHSPAEQRYRIRIQAVEERLLTGISSSEKEYYHERMDDSIKALLRVYPDSELMIRESAVYACDRGQKQGCPRCDPMPGCRFTS